MDGGIHQNPDGTYEGGGGANVNLINMNLVLILIIPQRLCFGLTRNNWIVYILGDTLCGPGDDICGSSDNFCGPR